jgi:pyruvate,water dikinase
MLVETPFSNIAWFEEVKKRDIATAGGKGANLGEMASAGIPIPPGFIVVTDAYHRFLKEGNLTGRIEKLLGRIDIDNNRQLNRTAASIRRLILNTEMPSQTAKEIEAAYEELGHGLVAVRSSATAEDLPQASFAGQQSTFLNIQGKDELIGAVKKCWASLFEARAIYYRTQYGFDHFSVAIAVPVQKMVQSHTSGVIFTIEPITNDASRMIIEATYGLGEALVSGEITPDLYLIDKEGPAIVSKTINIQEKKLTRNIKGVAQKPNIWQRVPPREQRLQKITDEDIVSLARLAMKIEKHYGSPQDIEWARENRQSSILQSRPVTAIKEKKKTEAPIKAPILLEGAAACPGIASGPVRIVKISRLDLVKHGDIMVAEKTTPDFVPAMKRAAAIVTDHGGRTSHAAIVSRELGIPCVVGTEKATRLLTERQIITVDGGRGKVYQGKVTRRMHTTSMASMVREAIKTKTRIYVNLAQPELADNIAKRNVDGIGLLRAEFIVGQIGKHPSYMIEQKEESEFIEKLCKGISTFTRAFNPRPVVYRLTDFKTNEYRQLSGGYKYEVVEENPMLGYRGASRYITDMDVFKLEIEAIKECRQQYKNLWLMIPFVRTVDELAQTVKILEEEGLGRSPDFKIWMMVEVPSNIFLLTKFLKVGIDGISIGSNDLTQLILGIDRDSEKLRTIFDERNEAVLIAIKKAISVAKRMGVTSSICGQAPSVYPELTEKLVAWGITSVSVSPDMIGITREMVARAEAKLKIFESK